MDLPFYNLKSEGSIIETVEDHYKRLPPLDEFWIDWLLDTGYIGQQDFIRYFVPLEGRIENRWIDEIADFLGEEIDNSFLMLEESFNAYEVRSFFKKNPGFLLYRVYPINVNKLLGKPWFIQAYWPFPYYNDEAQYELENEENLSQMKKLISVIDPFMNEEILEYMINLFETEENEKMAINKASKSQNGYISNKSFPLLIQKWQDLEITFTNKEYVKISINKSKPRKYHFSEFIGFKNETNSTPRNSWELMYALAQANGCYFQQVIDDLIPNKIEQLTKNISDLRRVLKRNFRCDDNPIIKNKGDGYITKFLLRDNSVFPDAIKKISIERYEKYHGKINQDIEQYI